MTPASTDPASVAWAKFLVWLRETHPRATGQAELVEALLELGPQNADLNQLEERLWPLDSDLAPEDLFRRQDRLRRLLANLRKIVARYNRLYSGQAASLILRRAQRTGGVPVPDQVARQSQPAVTSRAPAKISDAPHDAAAYSDTTATILWAREKLSRRERVRVATWLIDPLPDRTYEFSDSPEYWGEEAIRLGCAHDIELLARRDLPLLKDPGLRWKMLALWAEASDAVGLCGRLRATMEPIWAAATRAPELDGLPGVHYRLRRMWLRSIAMSSQTHASFTGLFETQATDALARGKRHEAFEISMTLLESLVYEGVTTDQPALLHRAQCQVMDMLRETGGADTEYARRIRQILHWNIRCYLAGDTRQLLEESAELSAWLTKNGFHRTAMRLQTQTVRLLRIWGETQQALALAIRNMTLGIRYVERARLLFVTREMACLLPHRETPAGNGKGISRTLSFLETRLSEIVHGLAAPPVPSRPGIARQLAPLSDLLPRIVEPDWQRLLCEIPDITAPLALLKDPTI